MSIFNKLIFCLLCVTQSVIFASGLENATFRHLSTENGLSQRSVQAIYQDSDGFLWLGTQEGLNRYDGREVKVFRNTPNQINSLSHDVIRAIIEDNHGNLWVATNGGLNRYLKAKEQFKYFPILDSTGNEILRINNLMIDNDGKMLVATDGTGIFKLDTSNIEQVQIEQFANQQLASADIRVLYRDTRDRLWVGTDGQGVFVQQGHRLKQYKADNTPKSLSNNRVRDIIEDVRGKIWIATRGGGVNSFDELTQSFKHYLNQPDDKNSLSHNRVYQIYQSRDNQLWFATDYGVNIYQPASDDFIVIKHKPSQQYGLNHDRVLSIYQDQSELMWIGTLSGLNQWNPHTAEFVHYRQITEDEHSLSNNSVISFAESQNGDIYIATFGGGLNKYHKTDDEIRPMLNPQQVGITESHLTNLMIDNQQRLWIGSVNSGVSVYDQSLNLLNHYDSSTNNKSTGSLTANGVTSMMQDSDGEFWVATYRAGLNRINADGTVIKQYRKDLSASDKLQNENVLFVMEDSEGYIWLATDGGGISRLDKNTHEFKQFTFQEGNPQSLSGGSAWSIYEDSRGRFWIGTQGYGLNRWEPEDRRSGKNVFKHYNIQSGLNSSTVNGVIEDNQGNIWVSTNRGVSKLNPDSDEIINFNLSDDFHFNEFNHGAILKASDGRLYFGGLRGISAFYPEQIRSNNHKPNVVLTNIFSGNERLLFDKPVSDLKEITFDHTDYLVVFEFAALDYAQPDKNHYRYMLVGFDDDWIELSNLNRATFTNLPSGNYKLLVQGSNNDGLWSDNKINLNLKILPAPWVSWWAIALYALSFSLVLMIFIRMQAKRLSEQELFQTELKEAVASKTQVYVKSNDLLKQQLEQIEKVANIDLETGLPSQRYLLDVMKQLMAAFEPETQAAHKPVNLILMNLPKFEHFASLAKQIAEDYKQQFLVIRWGENQLALLGFTDNLEQTTDITTKLKEQNANSKIAFSCYPFKGVKQQTLEAEQLLMLTEHALYSIRETQEHRVIGLTTLTQTINPIVVKELFDMKSLLDEQQVFDLYLY